MAQENETVAQTNGPFYVKSENGFDEFYREILYHAKMSREARKRGLFLTACMRHAAVLHFTFLVSVDLPQIRLF